MELCELHSEEDFFAFFNAYRWVSDDQAALKLLRSPGAILSTRCFNSVLYTVYRSGQKQQVMRVFRQMLARGFIPDAYTWRNLQELRGKARRLQREHMSSKPDSKDFRAATFSPRGTIHVATPRSRRPRGPRSARASQSNPQSPASVRFQS